MRKESFEKDGKEYVRISKSKAKRLFESGKTIFLFPVNMNINSMWACPTSIRAKEDIKFNDYIYAFIYYNCCPELGEYPKFFVSESEQ